MQIMVSFISATTINSWAEANPRRAQEILPEFVIRLILATSTKIKDFNFPIENGIQYSGYDGILFSEEETDFFPNGKSVWEFGTSPDIMGKFKSDIDKRYNKPLGEDIKNTVFIFVTLKIWNHKISIGELLNESKEKYDWKDIRIIDGSKIALWICQCPAVAIWFSEIMGEHIDGVASAEQYWEEYCNSTTPKLTADFFDTGRKSQVQAITEWLADNCDYKIISSESKLESLLFGLSVVFSLSEDEKNKFLSKIIIVKTLGAWNILLSKYHNEDIILIPVFNFNEDFSCPNSISVLLPISRYSTFAKVESIDKIELPVWNRDTFDDALKKLGYNSIDISKIEYKTKRRFMSFYRIITNQPCRKRPKWVDKSNIRELVPMMLVGRWNANYDGDKEIIAAISGKKYEEYIENLNEWLSIEDAPVFTGLNRYESVSIRDLWDFVFTKLTNENILTFRKCVIDIFSEVNKAFALPEEQWYMASVLGEKSKYSNELKQGIVISLIMLSENKDNNCNIISTEDFVYGLIKDILSPINTWQHWNTIAPSLPLLAEAAPTAVLEKLENEFKNVSSDIWRLFKPLKDLLFGTHYYTYILWALEALTCYKQYAIRAIKIFAEISEKNMEYNMANTPDESLYHIFCLWDPQSCLSDDERIRVIKQICNTHPACAWRLIDKLLPKDYSTSMPISKPKWRECDEILYASPVSQKRYFNMLNNVIDIIMGNVSAKKEQWIVIMQNISSFQNVFDTLFEKCITCCKQMQTDDVILICDELREQIYGFRKFRDAKWTVSEDYIDKLEMLFHKILPDSIKQYVYLFTWHPNILNPIPHSEGDNTDFEHERKVIYNERRKAIVSILNRYGQDALIDFCKYAQDVSDLGNILAEILLKYKYDFDIIKRLKKKHEGVYSYVIYTLLIKNGLDDSVNVLLNNKTLSDIEKGDVLCQFQLSWEVSEKVNMFSQETIRYYWEHVKALPGNESEDFVEYCILQLLNYKRPFSSVHYIVMSKCNNPKLIIEVLEKCVELKNTIESNGMTINSSSYYYYIQLFKRIYKDKNIDNFRVAKLELVFLSYFENETPQCLVKHLEQTPQEYINLISMAFKRDNSTTPPSDDKRKWADYAYRIISKFKRIPGCNADIQSEEVFLNWVNQAKDIADRMKYSKAFELCLGKLLSYAPTGDDGIFPHEIIRNLFENNNSEIIIGEFLTEKYNQREAHILTEGAEEEKIAQKYFEDANKIRIEYPHTAAILDELGGQYLGESRYEQKMAQMDFR